MKTFGLLGGMSWESSLVYYQLINQMVRERLGGHHSAQCLMYSVNFQEIKTLQHQGKWEEATEILIEDVRKLERGGADFLVICTNTMHKMAEQIQSSISIPLIHIADPTAQEITKRGIKKVGLLGTAFTMEQDFYKGRLDNKYQLEVLVPDAEARGTVHDIIYQELCLGIVKPDSKQKYVQVIEQLIRDGAEGIILGCTEITLLISEEDCSVPVFDTTRLHALSAVEYALTE